MVDRFDHLEGKENAGSPNQLLALLWQVKKYFKTILKVNFVPSWFICVAGVGHTVISLIKVA